MMPPAHAPWSEPSIIENSMASTSNHGTSKNGSTDHVVRRSCQYHKISSPTDVLEYAKFEESNELIGNNNCSNSIQKWKRRKREEQTMIRYLRCFTAGIGLLMTLSTFCCSRYLLQKEGISVALPSSPIVVESRTASERLKRRLGVQSQPPADIVHIVHTRFMQSQPDMIDLGMARLELLKTFTLKSLEAQTCQNFLLVVRTDPALNAVLREPLLEVLKGVENHLVIASNENPNVQVHNIKTVNPKDVWSGSLDRAKAYLESAETIQKILETRLDADDALQFQFIETIQENAIKQLPKKNSQWKIWCSLYHLEWQYHALTEKNDSSAGLLLSLKDGACISAGLTIGYTNGVHVSDLPPIKHHKLAKSVPACKEHGTVIKCLSYLELFPTALRARTPTSAGMLNIILGDKQMVDSRYVKGAKQQEKVQKELWNVAEDRFNFERAEAIQLRDYLSENIQGIALDNLAGQCSMGHSCKESSKKQLQAIVNSPEAFQ